MVNGLWVLVEELIRWQQMNAYMDAAGFGVCAIALCWLIIRVLRIERAIRTTRSGNDKGR